MLSTLFKNLNSYYSPTSFNEGANNCIELIQQVEFDASGDLLKQILEGNYKDGIDGFEGVKNDGKRMTGVFLDVINSKLTKRYRFEISENGISYQLENPNDIKDNADYSEIDFARTKMFGQSKQPKKCIKGTSCGNSCIKKGLKCSKPPTPEQKKAIAAVLGAEKKMKGKDNKINSILQNGIDYFRENESGFKGSGNIDRLVQIADQIKKKETNLRIVTPGMLNDLSRDTSAKSKYAIASDVAIGRFYDNLSSSQKDEIARQLGARSMLISSESEQGINTSKVSADLRSRVDKIQQRVDRMNERAETLSDEGEDEKAETIYEIINSQYTKFR
jgi:hypothetical protein